MDNTQKLAQLIDLLQQGQKGLGLGPQLAFSSIEDGKIVEHNVDGQQTSSWGKQFDDTHVAVTVIGPKPPKPNAPALTVTPGSLEVRWSGKFVENNVSPLDFKHVSVHLSRLMGFTADSSNQKATIRGELGDVATLLLPDSGTYYVKLVTWTLAGKASDPSDEISVVVEPSVDPSFLAQAIAEIEADIVEAKADAAIAQSTAASASSAATTASSNALSAVGIANGKGKTLIQSTAPGAEDRNNVTLWIDTTLVNGVAGNIPKKWVSGTTWAAVTDKTATDAAAAAATAKSRADEAFASAEVAATSAGNAMTAANGKSANWYQDNAPAGLLHSEGDTWWDTNDSFKMYSWNATTKLWVAKQLGTNALADLSVNNAKISAVDAGKISTGYLDVANRINAGSIYTDKMVITSTDNLHLDSRNEFPILWNNFNTANHPGAGWSTEQLFGGSMASQKWTPKTAQSNMSIYTNSMKRRVEVTEGDWYSVNSMVYADAAAGTGFASVSQQVYFYNKSNVQLSGGPGNITAGRVLPADWVPNTWTQVGGTPIQVPEGAAFMVPVLTVYYSGSAPVTTANWFIGPVQITRAMNSKLVVSGEIQGFHIKSDTMETRHFQADSVMMKHILVGDFTNMVADPIDNLGKPTSWAAGLLAELADTPPGFVNAVKTTAGQGTYGIPSPLQFMDVDPGSDILFSFWVKASKPNSRLYIEIRDQAGAHAATWRAVPAKANGGATGQYPFSTAVVPTVWTQYWAQGKVSSSAKKVRLGSLYFNHPAGTEKTAVVYVSGVTMKRQMQGEIIVDGALDAKLITGAKIQTMAATDRGITLDGYTNKMQAWNASGVKTFELDGATGNLMAIGEYYSDVAGKPRVRISDSLYGANYAGMTFEAEGTSTGLVAGIKTSLANDYWKGALFLTSANNPYNGYNTNMSEMRLASDRINYYVRGSDASQKALFEMDVKGYVSTSVFSNTGAIGQQVRNAAGTLLSYSSHSTTRSQTWYRDAAGNNKSFFNLEPEEILFAWAGTTTEAYNPDANFWMHNTGGTPQARFTLTNGWVEAPRLRLTATNDASETSTLHAFQIGADSAQSIKIDDNEIVATNAAGALQKIYVPGGMNFDTSYTMTGDTHVMTLGTYKKWIDPTILGTQNLDSITATGDYAQDKSADATIARKYPVAFAGLLEVRNPLGAVMIYQRYTTYDSTQKMYTRTKYNTAWTAWVQH